LSHAPTFNAKTSVIRYESYLQQKFRNGFINLPHVPSSRPAKIAAPSGALTAGADTPTLAYDANAGAKLRKLFETKTDLPYFTHYLIYCVSLSNYAVDHGSLMKILPTHLHFLYKQLYINEITNILHTLSLHFPTLF
jgi:hypothetical protein